MENLTGLKIGIVCKPQVSQRLPLLDELLAWCVRKGFPCILDPVASGLASIEKTETAERRDLPGAVDLLVVLGGDGTLLSVARHMEPREVPIIGVNLGHLGFLTEISTSEMTSTLEAYIKGDAPIQKRMVLEASLVRGGGTVVKYQCLNDAVLTKSAMARMIDLRVQVGDQWLTDMRADGLILSTPTGSTAYNLSAGGPIMTPATEGVIITPLCPHTLTMRPLVVDASLPLTVTLGRSAEEVYLTADGQEGTPVRPGDVVAVRRSAFSVPIVTSPHRDYFALLREKLGWGAGISNP